MTYPYPGDDPAALFSLSSGLDCAGLNMSTFASTFGQIRGQLNDAWQGDVASKADADLGTINKALPDISKRLRDGQTAVDTYRSVVVAVRSEVDNLRRQHDSLAANLSGLREQYARAGRFAEANDMTPTDVASYRQSLTTEQNGVTAKISALDDQYQAQVTKSNQAAQTCQSALTGSFTSTSYQGSTLTTITVDQLLGLNDLKAAHWAKMVADATQFTKDIKGINDSNLSPEERNQRIRALVAKYGLEANDPDFATTVATSEGPDYFKQLLIQTGAYDTKHPVDPALEKQLLQLNASILSTATNQHNSTHVDTKWIDNFFSDGHGGVNPESVMAGSDYTRLGIAFPTAFLDGVGKNALLYETQMANNLNANGQLERSWLDIGHDLFYPGGSPYGTDFYGNDDPLTSVMQQFADHPDAHSILFQDKTPDGKEDDLLYALTHRAWGDHGANALNSAIIAETGPNAGDPAAAGKVAQYFLHDVTQNPDSAPGYAGVPRELHNAAGTVVARYMASVIDQFGDGVPGSKDALLMSGLNGEGPVANLHFDPDDLRQALKFAYSDHGDTGVRSALSGAWASVSAHDMSAAYSDAKQALGGDGPYPYSPSNIFNTASASSQVLGLLTQSDINGFDSDVDRVNELQAQKREMLSQLEGLIPIPELPEGTPAAAGNVVDLGVDTIKDLVNEHIAPDLDSGIKGDHYNSTEWKALTDVDAYPKSIITHMSAAGLPIVYDPSTHDVTAVVATGQDPGHLFTTPDGHLKTMAQIAATPGGSAAFNDWYGHVSFTSGGLSSSNIQATIHDAYDEGVEKAVK